MNRRKDAASRLSSALVCCLACIASLGIVSSARAESSSGKSEAAPLIRGYPLNLAPSATGGVWYGGTGDGVESYARVDYITPTGAFLDFPFTGELEGHSPEYFAAGRDGEEWFLAYEEGHTLPLLGEVSPSGAMSAHALALPADSEVRGLAVGREGDLWMTDTRIEHLTRHSAILRMTPGGALTAFSRGLQTGANPLYITAAPGHALWFTDTVGRIGRISTDGAIREFPVGHGLAPGQPEGSIVASRSGDLWFLVGSGRIGAMTPSGHVRIIQPSQRYPEPNSAYEGSRINELAAGPEGDVWFIRGGGEVARITAGGRVQTITDRLEAAYGIGFAGDGEAWIGEGYRFREESGGEESPPARVARVSASGRVTQFPQPPPCRVPSVLGDGPHLAADAVRSAGCELASLTRPAHSHSNHLIVVSQSLRAGALVSYKTPVRLTLGPKPPAPRNCSPARYSRVLVRSRQLVVWKDPIEEPDNEASRGEGPQNLFACVPPRGGKHLIFSEEHDLEYFDGLEGLHAAGHFVAFSSTNENHYNNGSKDLTLYDATRGRTAFEASYEFGEGERGGIAVGEFALDARGDLAWIKEATSASNVLTDTLDLHEPSKTRAVESAAVISDLAIRGRTLTWHAEGKAHSQALNSPRGSSARSRQATWRVGGDALLGRRAGRYRPSFG